MQGNTGHIKTPTKRERQPREEEQQQRKRQERPWERTDKRKAYE